MKINASFNSSRSSITDFADKNFHIENIFIYFPFSRRHAKERLMILNRKINVNYKNFSLILQDKS